MTIIKDIYNLIENKYPNYLTLDELAYFCRHREIICKTATVERRLRPSECDWVERIEQNGSIIGYKFIKKGQTSLL